MTTALALLAILALSGAETTDKAVGVAMPDGVLDQAAATSPIKGPPAPTDRIVLERRDRFEPVADRPGVLVGNAAWYTQKFSDDQIMLSDHGEPMVVFTSDGPALPR